MSNRHSGLRDQSTPDTEVSQVLVVDIVRYLSGLAKLHEAEKTGNMELSRGLRHLVSALRPYADTPVSELTASLRTAMHKDSVKPAARRPRATLPDGLESLGQEEIERILDEDSYTKDQIAELGFRRFGISRSRLIRLRKKDARETVRAALAHEKSLDVISQEARIGGIARSA